MTDMLVDSPTEHLSGGAPIPKPGEASSRLSLRDKLLFAQAVYKIGAGVERWGRVKELMEGNPLVDKKLLFFDEESCSMIYNELMAAAGFENLEQFPDSASPNAPHHLRMAQHFYVARLEELRGEIQKEERQFRTLVSEIEAIKSGDTSYMLLSIFSLSDAGHRSKSFIHPALAETISVLDEVKLVLVNERKRKYAESGGRGRPNKKLVGGLGTGFGGDNWLPLGWTISQDELKRIATDAVRPEPEPVPEPIIAAPLQIQPIPRPILAVSEAIPIPPNRQVIVVPNDPEDPPARIPGEQYGRDIQMAQTLAHPLAAAGPSGRSARSSTLTTLTTSKGVGAEVPPRRGRGRATRGTKRRKGQEDVEIVSDGGGDVEITARESPAPAVPDDARKEDVLDQLIPVAETDEQAKAHILQEALAPATTIGDEVGLIAVDASGGDVADIVVYGSEIRFGENLAAEVMKVDDEASATAEIVEATDQLLATETAASEPAKIVHHANRAKRTEEEPDIDMDTRSAKSELTPVPPSVASEPSPPPMSPALPPTRSRSVTPIPDSSITSETAEMPDRVADNFKEELEEVVNMKPSTAIRSRRGTRTSIAIEPSVAQVAAGMTKDNPARRRSTRQKPEDTPAEGPGVSTQPDMNEEAHATDVAQSNETDGEVNHERKESRPRAAEEYTAEDGIADSVQTRRGRRRQASEKVSDRTSPTPVAAVVTRNTPARAIRAVSNGLENIVEESEPPVRVRRVYGTRKAREAAAIESEEEREGTQPPEDTEDDTGQSGRRGFDTAGEDDSDAQTDTSIRGARSRRRPFPQVTKQEVDRAERRTLGNTEAMQTKDKDRRDEDLRREESKTVAEASGSREYSAEHPIGVVASSDADSSRKPPRKPPASSTVTKDASEEARKAKESKQPAVSVAADAESTRQSPRKPSGVPSLIEGGPVKRDSSPQVELFEGSDAVAKSSASRATRSLAGTQIVPVDKRTKAMLNGLHEEIEGHIHARVFSAPIRAADAPGYSEIVKQPMHLKKIKIRIKQGQIHDLDEYQRDLWLMFCNAMMYNRPGSEVYDMAEEMMLWCEEKLSNARNLDHHTRMKHST